MKVEFKIDLKTGMFYGPEIYKRTATGATQVWRQEAQGGSYRTISGQQGGKLVTSAWKKAEWMNKGKKNERDPVNQARFEIASNYKKKLDKEYHLNPGSIDKAKNFLPMLAKDYKDYKDDLDFSELIFVQPKLDGMRCIAKADGLWSRNGKPILSTPHIFEALAPLFKKYPDLILDGELYNHEYKDDFNSIISSARMTKPTKEDLEISKSVIQYHVYDVPDTDLEFSLRFNSMGNVLESYIAKGIILVNTYKVSSLESIDNFYEQFLENGYEGQMIRLNTKYVNKRTSALLKRKENKSEEFTLVDIQEGKGNWAGKAKRCILKMKNGKTFAAGVTGTESFCAKILKDKKNYIGTLATIEYFALTPDGIPRFGRVKEFNRKDV